jgi:serine acetyltransferase
MRDRSRYILSPYLGNRCWCIKREEGFHIVQGVTLRARQIDMMFDLALRPGQGGFVLCGAAAKVLGRIALGDNVRVGATSASLRPVPANVTVSGVPAREVYSSGTEVPEVLKD